MTDKGFKEWSEQWKKGRQREKEKKDWNRGLHSSLCELLSNIQ